MCGIAGVLKFDGAEAGTDALLRRMIRLLSHRGPDDEGVWHDGPVALGHRRLSILDLSCAGHQPMAAGNGKIRIAYNGECYNFREQMLELQRDGVSFRSQTDTEVLLELYLRHGPSFIEKLDGMFSFAIWDSRTQSLMLGRDRLGIKPLYFHRNARRILFASEMKALLADREIQAKADPRALAEYLHYMSIPGERAIIQDIFKVPPGYYLLIRRGEIQYVRYWNISLGEPDIGDQDVAVEQFCALFRGSVSKHLVSDVPVGVLLSGGVDSSAIAAVARESRGSSLKSFVATFGGRKEFDEGALAQQVATHIGTEHYELDIAPDLIGLLPKILWHADEPFAISSSFALYLISKEVSKHVKVVLTGDGGDEVFAGYPWRHGDYSDCGKIGLWLFHRMFKPAALLARGLPGAWDRVIRRAEQMLGYRLDIQERYRQSFSTYQTHELVDLLEPDKRTQLLLAWESNYVRSVFAEQEEGSQLARKLLVDLKTTLVSEMLTKTDRMTMAFGLEARVPFLDHRLVEWSFRLSDLLKIQGGEGKFIVKKALESLLPKNVLWRPKHGFNVPLRDWFRNELREWVRDILGSDRARSREIFQPQKVSELLHAHDRGGCDHSNKIFVLLCLELWHRQFIDDRNTFAVA